MKLFKKITTSVIAATVMTVGLGSMNADAASWATSHVNMPGVPYSESTVATVTIYQRDKGAKAVCNYNSHTNANASTGTTTIRCVTYTMVEQVIVKTGEAICDPHVGDPLADIAVTYQISAITPTDSDVFWSKGTINKI